MWHFIALIVHLLALILLYITNICDLTRHCRTFTLAEINKANVCAANLEHPAYILHWDFNLMVAHHTCRQDISTSGMRESGAAVHTVALE